VNAAVKATAKSTGMIFLNMIFPFKSTASKEHAVLGQSRGSVFRFFGYLYGQNVTQAFS
jgi:hypothetical protein